MTLEESAAASTNAYAYSLNADTGDLEDDAKHSNKLNNNKLKRRQSVPFTEQLDVLLLKVLRDSQRTRVFAEMAHLKAALRQYQ